MCAIVRASPALAQPTTGGGGPNTLPRVGDVLAGAFSSVAVPTAARLVRLDAQVCSRMRRVTVAYAPALSGPSRKRLDTADRHLPNRQPTGRGAYSFV